MELTHGHPPIAAAGPLIAAMEEVDSQAVLGSLLIVLGATGAPEATPIIDQYRGSKNEDLRESAHSARSRWIRRRLRPAAD